MSQALYTSMGGISAATSELQVISNNVANINTIAFKKSSVEFSDVYSTTLSYGSVATSDSGGTNPIQAGVGTKVSAVSTDFTTGSWVSTGSSTDLMINGSGFFTVKATDGSTYYTRAGDFSIDSSGNLVTSEGYKVEGTGSILSSKSSGETVKIPLSISPTISGNSQIASATITDLNNLQNKCSNITSGTFEITTSSASTSQLAVTTITLSSGDVSGTVENLVKSIQSQLGASSGITVSCANGEITFTADGTTATGLKFASGTSNFLSATGMSSDTKAASSYSSSVLDYHVDISSMSSASEATSESSTTINSDGSLEVTYADGSTLSVELDSSGDKYQFVYTTADSVAIKGDNCNVSSDVASTSNFVIQMATVTNTEGLLSVGSNLYKTGPNTGDVVYTTAGQMGTGKIESGGYEASNVDLSTELSNMILAQRAVQANSRVFTTTSSIMQVINQMGQ